MQARNPIDSLGIDISKYQGRDINWSTVKQSGISFVIIKSTEGSSGIDPYFKQNIINAKNAGLYVGVYHFCRAKDAASAIFEADFFISVINSIGGFRMIDLHPVLDLETPEGATKASVSLICRTWINRVKAVSTTEPILYSYPSFADTYLDVSLSDIPLWLANYGTEHPLDRSGWKIWLCLQYSETGKVNGISGAVDLDEFSGNISDYVKKIHNIQEDEDNMALNLNEAEWEMLNNIWGQRYNDKQISDYSWLQKIHSKTLTAGELSFLNCVIQAREDKLSTDANSYGMNK